MRPTQNRPLISRPENKITKEYYAKLEKPIDEASIKKLQNGVFITVDNLPYITKECKVKMVRQKEILISISEGKKRQIRKMIDAVGNRVLYLRRNAIGNLKLGNLKTAELKPIKREDIYRQIGLKI